jgi:hypothetical protein
VDYERTGRKLGTAAKVLGRMAKQRLEDSPAAPAPTTTPARPRAPQQASCKVQAAKEGGKRFGEAVWKPFTRAGHVLWLEVTGVFFGLFAFGFGAEAWKVRASWRNGPEHARFVEYALVTALFVYFCGSSFVRARRREKR